MGYAAPLLQQRRSALTTGLGSVWALWHVIPELSVNPPAWVAEQCFFTMVLRVLMVWLYNNTGKSVFVVILFHDMANVSEFAFPNYGLLRPGYFRSDHGCDCPDHHVLVGIKDVSSL
jgi:hypothetical protein